jgi:hypothetical protein
VAADELHFKQSLDTALFWLNNILIRSSWSSDRVVGILLGCLPLIGLMWHYDKDMSILRTKNCGPFENSIDKWRTHRGFFFAIDNSTSDSFNC